jgi:transketolase
VKDKPSLIICRTVIGFGSPNKAGKEEAHGAALGEEEVALTRQTGLEIPAFEIPKEIYRAWDAREEGEKRSTPGTRNLPPTSKRTRTWPEFSRRMSGDCRRTGKPKPRR